MRRATAVLLVALVLATGARAGDADVIGRAGSADITMGAARAHLETLPEAERKALASDPAALARAVRTWMAERLVLNAAREAAFDTRPDIAARLARARETLLMDLFLQSQAAVPADYPAEAAVRAVYEKAEGKLATMQRYRLAQIFIAAPKDEPAGAKLDEVQRKLKGKDATSAAGFAALAKALSDSKIEAARGGEIGWLSETAVAPEILAALKGVKPGGVTAPIRLANGWHIVRLMEVKPIGGKLASFETAKDQLADQMRRRRQDEARRDYVAALIDRGGLTLDEPALERLAGEMK